MAEGTTREVELDLDYNPETAPTIAHIRIANLSKPAGCKNGSISQSACGFVVGFVEAISSQMVTPAASETTPGTGNTGSWPASRIRAYLNGTKYREGESAQVDFTGIGIIDALPNDIQSLIIETSVISGHGINDSANFTSTDKLYLLDTKEIYGDSFTDTNHTAKDSERQLDYYEIKETAINKYQPAKKLDLSKSSAVLWLRSPTVENNYQFYRVNSNGASATGSGRYANGISPAFRIAN